MFEIFKFGGGKKEELVPMQEDLSILSRSELQKKLNDKVTERDELLGMRTTSFGSAEDMAQDAKSKELDKEVETLRAAIAKKDSERMAA